MDLMNVLAGLVAFLLSVAASALLVFGTYRLNTVLTSKLDEERLLLAGNRSVAVALGAIVFSQALLLRHAVFPSMVVLRDLFVRPVSVEATLWVLGHVLAFVVLVSVLAIGSVLLAAFFFTRMTRALPEREQILEDNLAVAILFACVVLAVALIVNEGLADFARSLIPYGQTGTLHLE